MHIENNADNILKAIVRTLGAQKENFLARQKHRRINLEDIVTVTEDWGEKRINSIIREAERIGIEFMSANDGGIVAAFKGVELKGNIAYEFRGWGHKTTKWTRPRMTLRLWIHNKKGEKLDAVDGNRRWSGGKGGEALSIVFGKERMMTYNRLLIAMMSCMGK
jgi:hypothetical protein